MKANGASMPRCSQRGALFDLNHKKLNSWGELIYHSDLGRRSGQPAAREAHFWLSVGKLFLWVVQSWIWGSVHRRALMIKGQG